MNHQDAGVPGQPSNFQGQVQVQHQEYVHSPVGIKHGFKRHPNVISLILSVLIWGLAGFALAIGPADPIYLIILGAFIFFYLIYLVESYCSKTARGLRNVAEPMGLIVFHKTMVATGPVIRWTIQCYHYERRTRTYTDSDGHRRTTTERVRVDTHRASATYNIQGWSDASHAPRFTNTRLTQVSYIKTHSFRDAQAEERHNTEYRTWINLNDRDTHKTTSWTLNLAGFKSNFMEVAEGVSLPCWFNLKMFWMYSFAMMSYPLRLAFHGITAERAERIHKVIW